MENNNLSRRINNLIALVCKTIFFLIEEQLRIFLVFNSRKETGEESYLVPVGGSNVVGLYGYLTAFEEMMSQVIIIHKFFKRDFQANLQFINSYICKL